jgi:hypothetical protein
MAGGTDHTTHRLRQGGALDRGVLLRLAGVQLACSVLAYAVYQLDRAAVLAIGATIVLTWIAMLWVFLRMPTVAHQPESAEEVLLAS